MDKCFLTNSVQLLIITALALKFYCFERRPQFTIFEPLTPFSCFVTASFCKEEMCANEVLFVGIYNSIRSLFLIVKLFFYCGIVSLQCQFSSEKTFLSLSVAQMVD